MLDRPDGNPLEPQVIVNNAGRLASEQDLLPIRHEAENRLKLFDGKIKKIRGNIYYDINDYRCWTGRAIVGELKATKGIDVARWNRLSDSLEGKEPTEVPGVKLSTLRAPFRSGDFVVCEDEAEFTKRSVARALWQEHAQRVCLGARVRAAIRSQLRQGISVTLKALFASVELVTMVEQLFSGHQVLFNQTAKLQDSSIAVVEAMAQEFNSMWASPAETLDSVEPGFEQSQIDLDAIRANSKTKAEFRLQSIKELAHVGALQMLGRDEAALRFGCEVIAKAFAAFSATKQASEPNAPKRRKSALDKFWDRAMKGPHSNGGS
jgi:hypothetical protein